MDLTQDGNVDVAFGVDGIGQETASAVTAVVASVAGAPVVQVEDVGELVVPAVYGDAHPVARLEGKQLDVLNAVRNLGFEVLQIDDFGGVAAGGEQPDGKKYRKGV